MRITQAVLDPAEYGSLELDASLAGEEQRFLAKDHRHCRSVLCQIAHSGNEPGVPGRLSAAAK